MWDEEEEVSPDETECVYCQEQVINEIGVPYFYNEEGSLCHESCYEDYVPEDDGDDTGLV
jgi:hypothetical protein